MKQKRKSSPTSKNQDEELLDEIERLLFKAKQAKRPFMEFLLRLAFLEALENTSQNEQRMATPIASESK